MKQKQVDEHFNIESTFWRDAYKKTDVMGTIFNQRMNIALKFVEELSFQKTAHILEIGCGAGFLSVALAKKGFTIEAIDSASSMIKLAKYHAKQKGMSNRVHLKIGDAHKLTFDERSFDLVIALGVIGWLHNPQKGLSEISRVLKPSGYVILSIDNPHRFWRDPPLFLLGIIKNILERIGVRNPPSGAHAQYYSIKEIQQKLSKESLISIKNARLGFGAFTLFGKNILSDHVSMKIHQILQNYADYRCSVLRKLASQHILLASKRMTK